MGKEWHNIFSVLCSLLFVAILAVVCSVDAKTPAKLPSATSQQSQEAQSVSGTIASRGRNSFTLTLGSAISGHGREYQQTTPTTMTFLIDKSTTVDGQLRVGASAAVTYRVDNGNNVAISVRVGS